MDARHLWQNVINVLPLCPEIHSKYNTIQHASITKLRMVEICHLECIWTLKKPTTSNMDSLSLNPKMTQPNVKGKMERRIKNFCCCNSFIL